MPLAADIHAKVTNVLVEVLVVKEDDVTPTAALQRDLRADSLDLLEIIFRLEQEFGIEIQLFPDFRLGLDWVQDGKLTDNGSAELRARLPYADLGGVQVDRRLSAIADLLTVDLLIAYIQWKLARGTATDREPSKNGSDRSVREAVAKSNDSPQGSG